MIKINFNKNRKIRELFFLQILKAEQSAFLPAGITIDYDALGEISPTFLDDYNFKNKSLELFFRCVKFYDLQDKILKNYFYDESGNEVFPESIFIFDNIDISKLTYEDFPSTHPVFFTEYDSSIYNDLIVGYFLFNFFIHKNNGQFLNRAHRSSIFLNHHSISATVLFINENLIAIELIDSINGNSCKFMRYENGKFIDDSGSEYKIEHFDSLLLLEERDVVWGLENLSPILLENKEAVLLTLNRSHFSRNFSHVNFDNISSIIDSKLLSDFDVVKKIIEIHESNYNSLPKEFREKEEIALEAVRHHPGLFNYVSEDEYLYLDGIPEHFRSDQEFIKKAVQNNSEILFMNPDLMEDKILIKIVLENDGMLLGKLPDDYRNDKKLVLFAFQTNKQSILTVGETLKSEDVDIRKKYDDVKKSFIEKLYKTKEKAKSSLPYSHILEQDIDILKAAVLSGRSINAASIPESLQDDKQFILDAYKQSRHYINHASDNLKKNDEEIKMLWDKLNVDIENDKELPF